MFHFASMFTQRLCKEEENRIIYYVGDYLRLHRISNVWVSSVYADRIYRDKNYIKNVIFLNAWAEIFKN